MKVKELVPVPVAGPALGSGVKFVMFYVLSSFLQSATEITSIQSSFSPICYPCLQRYKQRTQQHLELKEKCGYVRTLLMLNGLLHRINILKKCKLAEVKTINRKP